MKELKRLPERSARRWYIQSCETTNALSCISLTHFEDVLTAITTIEKYKHNLQIEHLSVHKITEVATIYNWNIIIAYTCSGVRSNFLPPIVKETAGMEDKPPQSTADSPIGLGSRSHSCKYTTGMSMQKQL